MHWMRTGQPPHRPLMKALLRQGMKSTDEPVHPFTASTQSASKSGPIHVAMMGTYWASWPSKEGWALADIIRRAKSAKATKEIRTKQSWSSEKTKDSLHTFYHCHCIIVLCICVVNRSITDTSDCEVCLSYVDDGRYYSGLDLSRCFTFITKVVSVS
jgi:hypothetical protein